MPRAGENTVVWTLWLTYGAFYFCRQNLPAAVAAMPGLESPVAEGGLGLSRYEVSWILASLKIAYGIGQFANGQLSERISPRVMLAMGMFGSAALNVLFGFSTGFFFLLFVWAANGFCQSLGWTPCVRVIANWIPVARRGKAVGIIGTGYQITLGLTFLIAGQAAEHFGWRGALYVPAILLALAGVIMLVFLQESPADGPISNAGVGRASARPTQISFTEGLYWTLYNPALWLLGTALALLNACRYGYFDWGLKHLTETRQMPVGKAVLEYVVIAIGATAGSYLAGWATDRFFGSRRAPVVCLLLVVLGVLSLFYENVAQHSAIGTMLLLVLIGFCIMGPQVLLVGTAPADLAIRGASAAAAGFVNFMGYIGAATGVVVTGYVSDPEHGGWRVAIFLWAGWAFAGAAIMAILWNTTSGRVRAMPAVVPKLGAIAALASATTAATLSEQPGAVQIVAYAGAASLLGTFASRWAAVPGLIAAAACLLTVFIRSTQQTGSVTWQQSAAMIFSALTMIAAIMILVERKGVACESS
jgi:sugar phosphate permease